MAETVWIGEGKASDIKNWSNGLPSSTKTAIIPNHNKELMWDIDDPTISIIIDDETDRLYANLSGRVAYNISPRMKANIDFGYLNQTGQNIDLDAMTARAEFVPLYARVYHPATDGGARLGR